MSSGSSACQVKRRVRICEPLLQVPRASHSPLASHTSTASPRPASRLFSDTYMTAVVPAGATTGPVVVTTPVGLLSSNVNFRISK